MTSTETHSHLLDNKGALDFILAGKAKFTIKNAISQKRFTYKVVNAIDRETQKPNENLKFVKLMIGNENDSEKSYKYLGMIVKTKNGFQYRHGAKSKIGPDAPGAIMFPFVFERLLINRQMNGLEVWHEGRCCRCGRTLTVPESIESGWGPECIKHRH